MTICKIYFDTNKSYIWERCIKPYILNLYVKMKNYFKKINKNEKK